MSECAFNLGGARLTGELIKVTRGDLYGESRIKVLGPDDKPLTKAAVPEDGGCYIVKGEVKLAQKVDDEYSLSPTEAVDPLTGNPMEPVPSSFKVLPNFHRTTAEEVSMLEAQAVYEIKAGSEAKLAPGDLFLGHFNYRAGLERKDAAIVTNQFGTFLLVGNLKGPAFIGMEADSQLIIADASEENGGEEDNDFGSLM